MAPILVAEVLPGMRGSIDLIPHTLQQERIPAPSVDSGTEEMRGPIASEDRRALAASMAEDSMPEAASTAEAIDKGEK